MSANEKVDLLKNGKGLLVPCGKCIACRISRVAEWTTRMMHQLEESKVGCFITLTYANDFLPKGGTLDKKELQLFMKRLRKFLEPTKVKYYACGEYGDEENRPHYHIALFGWQPDLKKMRKHGRYWESLELNPIWPYGNNTVGTLTKDSCQYVAGYMKKKYSKNMYPSEIQQPFAFISQGMGKNYAEEKGLTDPNSEITKNGERMTRPRYYQKLWKAEGHEDSRKAMLNMKSVLREEELMEKLGGKAQLDMAKETDRISREAINKWWEENTKKGVM